MERSTPVTVRHLLSHTSGDPPGTSYRYDGNAFGSLTRVVERVTGQPFGRELTNRIVRPLGLTRTAPYPGDPRAFWSLVASVDVTDADVAAGRATFAASGLERAPIEAALAQGYARSWGRWIWPTGLAGPMRPMAHGFTLSTTAGLVASAPDVARFSIALDEGVLLNTATRNLAWTRPLAPDGTSLPYALGWFVQDLGGRRVVWHYGHALESSSLLVKLPSDHVTFVILANSDGLSRWRGLGDTANVTASPAATLFLKWNFAKNNVDDQEKAPVQPR
jgi:CubicO group peptidase (beta-lactamase class C family)